MLTFLVLLACGEKAEDTAIDTTETTDTAVEDTGGESTEGSEGSGETGGGETGGTDTEDTGTETGWSAGTMADLTVTGGCGDYFLYAHNAEDTLALHIAGSNVAMEAHQSPRGVFEYTYTINPMTDDIQPLITAQEGEYLNAWSCNDAAINEPRIDNQYVAISGTVSVTVVAEGEMTDWGEVPANMTLEMTDVCFEAPEAFCIESYTMTEFIGWMPG